ISFFASCRQLSRHCLSEDSYCALCASGTFLVTQSSYLAIKSSHSAMPIFSPLVVEEEEVVVVVAGVDGAVTTVFLLPSIAVELLLLFAVLHPIKNAAHRTARIKRLFLNIGTPSVVQSE